MRLTLLLAGLCVLFSADLEAQDRTVWTPLISNTALYSVATGPQGSETIFAGGQARIFYRSTDGGVTWEEMSVGAFGGASQLSVMVVHPTEPGIVFAGGQGFDGLARSTDNGDTWTTVLVADDLTRFELGGAGSLAIDPANPSTLYVLRFTIGEVYRSTDTGATWELISTIPGLETTDRMRALTVDPTDPQALLASGRRAQIMRSTDGGVTWDSTDMTSMTLQRDEDVAQFAWSLQDPNVVIATVQRSLHPLTTSAGLWRSTDRGATWNRWRFTDTSLYAMQILPGLKNDELLIGGNQFSYPEDLGNIRGDSLVLYSQDAGESWSDISNVPWMDNELGDPGVNIWGFAVTHPPSIPEEFVSRVFMATDGGLYRRDLITSVADDREPPTIRALQAIAPVTQTVFYDHATMVVHHYEIKDLAGRVLKSAIVTTPGQIQLPDLAPGTYVLEYFSPTQHHIQLMLR